VGTCGQQMPSQHASAELWTPPPPPLSGQQSRPSVASAGADTGHAATVGAEGPLGIDASTEDGEG